MKEKYRRKIVRELLGKNRNLFQKFCLLIMTQGKINVIIMSMEMDILP